MALTRSLLKGMGLTDEQIDSIIEAHRETVDGLKNQISTLKADADKLPGIQKQLDDLQAGNGDDWKTKFEAEHAAFEAFKSDTEKKATHAAKETAYRALLKKAGVRDARLDTVLKVSDVDSVELDKDGNITGADELENRFKTEWADFMEGSVVTGPSTPNPPANTGGNAMTKEQILAIKDAAARQKAIAENMSLFGY